MAVTNATASSSSLSNSLIRSPFSNNFPADRTKISTASSIVHFLCASPYPVFSSSPHFMNNVSESNAFGFLSLFAHISSLSNKSLIFFSKTYANTRFANAVPDSLSFLVNASRASSSSKSLGSSLLGPNNLGNNKSVANTIV